MKLPITYMIATACLAIAVPAFAAELPAAANAKCGACHAVGKRLVGPSYMDISAKFKSDKDAAGKIAVSITKGGSFGWKLGAMPPRGMGANDADIKTMSEFIAGLAK